MMNEEDEAHLVDALKKHNIQVNKDIAASTAAITDMYEGLLERGLPDRLLRKFIGRMMIITNHDSRESDIYPKVLQLSLDNMKVQYESLLEKFGKKKRYPFLPRFLQRNYAEDVIIDIMSRKQFIVMNPVNKSEEKDES